jgi:hypothetical protein
MNPLEYDYKEFQRLEYIREDKISEWHIKEEEERIKERKRATIRWPEAKREWQLSDGYIDSYPEPFRQYVHPRNIYCERQFSQDIIDKDNAVHKMLERIEQEEKHFLFHTPTSEGILEYITLGGMDVPDTTPTELFLEEFFIHHTRYHLDNDATNYSLTSLYNSITEILSICNHSILKKYAESMLYEDFLRTYYWKVTKKYLKKESDYTCQWCRKGDKELHIHHLTYDHLGSELYFIKDLVCLCKSCHKKAHPRNNFPRR